MHVIIVLSHLHARVGKPFRYLTTSVKIKETLATRYIKNLIYDFFFVCSIINESEIVKY